MLVLIWSYSKCSVWIATININSPSETYIPLTVTGFQDEMMGKVEGSPTTYAHHVQLLCCSVAHIHHRMFPFISYSMISHTKKFVTITAAPFTITSQNNAEAMARITTDDGDNDAWYLLLPAYCFTVLHPYLSCQPSHSACHKQRLSLPHFLWTEWLDKQRET